MFPRLQHTSLAVARSVFDFLTRIPRQLSSAVRNRITFPFSFEASFGTIPPSLRLVPSSRAKFWHVNSITLTLYLLLSHHEFRIFSLSFIRGITLAFSIALPAMLGGEVLVASPFAYLPALPVYLLENHPSRLVFVRTKHGKTVRLI